MARAIEGKRAGVAVSALGLEIVLWSLLADALGIGGSPGFGWKQITGLVIGPLLVAVGAWLLFGRQRRVDQNAAVSSPGGEAETLRIPRLPALLAVVWSVTALAVVATAIFAGISSHSMGYFTRDRVSAVAQEGCSNADCAYAGLLSNLGVLIWLMAAGCCFVVAYRAAPSARLVERLTSPFLYAGLLSTAFLVDDLFQLHEWELNRLLAADVELPVFATYAVACLVFAICFESFLRRTELWLLAVSLALFSLSIVVDRLLPENHLLEDGSKLFGMVTWATYWAGTGLAYLKARTGRAGPRPGTCKPRSTSGVSPF